MAETQPANEELCQHIHAQRVFIMRDLTTAAKKASRYREGTPAYLKAVEDIERLRSELDKHKGVVQVSGPTCRFCLERGD
jgi:hypothetical protein